MGVMTLNRNVHVNISTSYVPPNCGRCLPHRNQQQYRNTMQNRRHGRQDEGRLSPGSLGTFDDRLPDQQHQGYFDLAIERRITRHSSHMFPIVSEIPRIHSDLKMWGDKKKNHRFWLENIQTNQKMSLGSKVQYSASKLKFDLVTRSPLTTPPTHIHDYAYTFVVPRAFMFINLKKFKNEKFYTAFKSSASNLGSAPGTRYISYDDDDKKKMLGNGDTTYQLFFDEFAKRMSQELSTVMQRSTTFKVELTVLVTDESSYQDPHVDESEVHTRPWHLQPWIVHIPLCRQGRVIRIWDENVSTSKHFGVPFGSSLVLPASAYHAGCYCRSPGNMGLVMKFTPSNAASSVERLQLRAPFSTNDLFFNSKVLPSQVHALTYDSFPGFATFTQSYIHQVNNWLAGNLESYHYDNVSTSSSR
jgi:hypothetical protein